MFLQFHPRTPNKMHKRKQRRLFETRSHHHHHHQKQTTTSVFATMPAPCPIANQQHHARPHTTPPPSRTSARSLTPSRCHHRLRRKNSTHVHVLFAPNKCSNNDEKNCDMPRKEARRANANRVCLGQHHHTTPHRPAIRPPSAPFSLSPPPNATRKSPDTHHPLLIPPPNLTTDSAAHYDETTITQMMISCNRNRQVSKTSITTNHSNNT
jgi:hypothetical protein